VHHAFVRGDLPAGTVTFLLTDVEGSTKLLHALGAEQALAMLQQAIRLSHRLNDPAQTAIGLNRVAQILALAGNTESAVPLVGRALETFDDHGVVVPAYIAKRRDEALAALREQLDEETLTGALERGRELSLDEADELALEDRSLAE
jgi:hypothetical protein